MITHKCNPQMITNDNYYMMTNANPKMSSCVGFIFHHSCGASFSLSLLPASTTLVLRVLFHGLLAGHCFSWRYVYIYIYVYVYVYVYMYMCKCICVYLYMYMCICICVYVYVSVYMYMCICIYVYVYVYICMCVCMYV